VARFSASRAGERSLNVLAESVGPVMELRRLSWREFATQFPNPEGNQTNKADLIGGGDYAILVATKTWLVFKN